MVPVGYRDLERRGRGPHADIRIRREVRRRSGKSGPGLTSARAMGRLPAMAIALALPWAIGGMEAMDDTTQHTLRRWLTGPRFTGLPMRDAAHPAPLLSFEFSPPRPAAMEQPLWTCINRFAPLRPRF